MSFHDLLKLQNRIRNNWPLHARVIAKKLNVHKKKNTCRKLTELDTPRLGHAFGINWSSYIEFT